MVEKMKTDVDIILLILITKRKRKVLIDLVKLKLFFIFQTKSCLSTSVCIFSTIFQILKTKFHVFWTQTLKANQTTWLDSYLIGFFCFCNPIFMQTEIQSCTRFNVKGTYKYKMSQVIKQKICLLKFFFILSQNFSQEYSLLQKNFEEN